MVFSSRFIGDRVVRIMAAVLLLLLLGSIRPDRAAAQCPPGLPCAQPAWQTVGIEHRDRKQRLLRLAAGRLPFEFFETSIAPAQHGLHDFPVSLPILRVVAGQDIFFDSGSDVIRREAYGLLDIIAGSLRLEPPDVTVFVAGHTDWDGSDPDNYQLGLRRAEAVASALARRGIYQAAIYRVSFGERLPIADNRTSLGKARNRRVEFLFSARPQPITTYLRGLPINPCSEDRGDPKGSCRVPIPIEAVRIAVPVERRKEIEQIEKKVQVIATDPTLTPVEVITRRQEIEAQRDRIPIEISAERIPIDLSGQ